MGKRSQNDPPDTDQDEEPTRQQPMPPFGDSGGNPTRKLSISSTQTKTKPMGPARAHDKFEVDIDVDDEEFKITDLFDDADAEKTRELPELELNAANIGSVIDLSLPETSDQEALPFYVPGGRTTPSPIPRAREKKPTPAPKPKHGPDFEALFDMPIGEEESAEQPALHLPPEREPSADLSLGLPVFVPGTPRSTTPGSDSKPKPRFAKGFTAGMTPLDVSEFAAGKPRKKKKGDNAKLPPRTSPAPMAGSKKVVRRRFVFTMTVRDVILLLLVLVLAAGFYMGWKIYDDYRHAKEIEKLGQKQRLIEKSKSEAIKSKEPRRETEIP